MEDNIINGFIDEQQQEASSSNSGGVILEQDRFLPIGMN